MIKQRFTLRAAVYLILIKDGNILLLKRHKTGWMDGWYSLPAGHLDGTETVTKAMVREAKEEIGIEIAKKDLRVVHIMHRKSDIEYIDFFFVANHWKNNPKLMETDKSSEVRWFPLAKFPEKTVPYIKKVVMAYNKNVFYSEEGW